MPATSPTAATPRDLTRSLVGGAVAGMLAAVAMAMFAMVASVTYQHHGFFTPLLHMSALLGSPKAMMTSVHRAMAGQRFWLTPGAALTGALIHMMTGAGFGIVFGVIVRSVPRRLWVPIGVLYGLAVFVVSAFVGLPIAATVTGSGSVISEMARIVGRGTFAAEHVLFGLTLAAVTLVVAPSARLSAPETARRQPAVTI